MLAYFQFVHFHDERSGGRQAGHGHRSATFWPRFLDPGIRDALLIGSLDKNALFHGSHVTRLETWSELISQSNDQPRVNARPEDRSAPNRGPSPETALPSQLSPNQK